MAEDDSKNESASTDTADKKKKTAGGMASASEETASPYPNMDLCQKIHRLTSAVANGSSIDAELEAEVFEKISVELENPSLYRKVRKALAESMTSSSSATVTEEALKEMEKKNEAQLKELENAVEEARESAGDMEVMEARVEVARFAAKSLSEEETLATYQKLLELPKVSSGKKIDALMESARVASFYGDTAKADELIEKAHKMTQGQGGGGDWDRRNRLKVYRALQKLLHRDTAAASKLLLDCIATFSCNEICSYADFIGYAILTCMLHLPRPELKEKIIDGPEVLSVSAEIPMVVSIVLPCSVSYFCSWLA